MEVRGEALVDRGVERHLAGAVHHDVQVVRQRRHVGQLALEDGDAITDKGTEVVRPALAQPLEGRFGEQLPDAVRAARPAPRAHEDDDGGVRKVEEDALEQRLPDEPGHARDEQALTGQSGGERRSGHGCGVCHPSSRRGQRAMAAAVLSNTVRGSSVRRKNAAASVSSPWTGSPVTQVAE